MQKHSNTIATHVASYEHVYSSMHCMRSGHGIEVFIVASSTLRIV